MDEEILNGTEEQTIQDPLVPGTYQIRKITSRLNPMELLATAEHLAAGGYDKKLFGVLSRVFTEHKGFHYEKQEGMEALLQSIMASAGAGCGAGHGMGEELLTQTYQYRGLFYGDLRIWETVLPSDRGEPDLLPLLYPGGQSRGTAQDL